MSMDLKLYPCYEPSDGDTAYSVLFVERDTNMLLNVLKKAQNIGTEGEIIGYTSKGLETIKTDNYKKPLKWLSAYHLWFTMSAYQNGMIDNKGVIEYLKAINPKTRIYLLWT